MMISYEEKKRQPSLFLKSVDKSVVKKMMVKRAFEGVVWLNVVIFFLMYNFFNISKAIIKSKFYIFFLDITKKKQTISLSQTHP